jgi:hypothetical protein
VEVKKSEEEEIYILVRIKEEEKKSGYRFLHFISIQIETAFCLPHDDLALLLNIHSFSSTHLDY